MENPATRSSTRSRALRRRVVDERETRGSLEIFIPAPHICFTVASGHFSHSMAKRWIDVVGPMFRDDMRFVTFHDWVLMTSYDSAARRALTTWLLANARYVESADFNVHSRLVAMGVAVANVATTLAGLPMVAHTSQDAFDNALARAL